MKYIEPPSRKRPQKVGPIPEKKKDTVERAVMKFAFLIILISIILALTSK